MQNPLTDILALPTERLNDPKFNRYINEKSGAPMTVLDTLAMDTNAPVPMGTNNSNVTNMLDNNTQSFDIEKYLTPPYFGACAGLFLFAVLSAFPGRMYTRIKDLDEPNERSRDWLKISLTSTTVSVGVWFLTSFLSLH